MDQPIKGTYENGVFRPLTPPDLPEHTPVNIFIAPSEQTPSSEPDERVAAKQKLQSLWDKINADPTAAGPDDGWSVANNADDVLYGGANGPA